MINPKILPSNQIKLIKRFGKSKCKSCKKKVEWDNPEEIEKQQKRLLKYHRIVVFEGIDIPKDAKSRLDLKEEILLECERVGKVTAIHLVDDYDLITIKFKERQQATTCKELMNERWFAGKQIRAFTYDGNFKIKESKDNQKDEASRIDQFGEWLEDQDSDTTL